MEAMTIRQQKYQLRCETAAWQKVAAGLLAIATVGNMAFTARIAVLEAARAEDAERYQEELQAVERYQEELQAVERVLDRAVEQLGAVVLQAEQDAESRYAQAAAYEAVGDYRYIGECTITYYCCESYRHICGTGDGLTATGIPVTPGVVAVDPDVIPLGSTVIIDGQKYLAADTGVTGMHVDVAVPGHQEALDLGVRTADVWVVRSE